MDGSVSRSDRDASQPYAIVVGSEKGGTGKSTTAMHLAVALLKAGFQVGCIDLDSRQASLSGYIDNRARFAAETGRSLGVPRYCRVEPSGLGDPADAQAETEARFEAALAETTGCQFVIIDAPGQDSPLARLGHYHADTLVTPLNDSFLDIAVLAVLDCRNRQVLAPSHYSQMVWEQNNLRIVNGKPPVDWIVMRNRLTHIEARNKREIADLLVRLGQRLGFRPAAGLGERVIYRELYYQGLTVLDLADDGPAAALTSSQQAACREVQDLLKVIGLGEQVA